MKRKTIGTMLATALTVALVPTLLAAERRELTDAERAERMKLRDRAIMRTKGGFVVKPGSQKGKIVFVNSQSLVDEKIIAEAAEKFRKSLLLDIEVVKASVTCSDVSKLSSYVSNIPASAALFVISDASMPTLVSAPENRWTILNVASLQSPKPKVFERRVRLELIRAFGLLAGGCNSQYENSVMRPVPDIRSLDEIFVEEYPLDVMQRINLNLTGFGITPLYRTTYYHAVKEGWAPQPTNEFQKAIWDKVHEAPTAPIVIKPEPAKKK